MKNRCETLAYYGLLTALALLLSFLESMVPIPAAVPGMKLGLANLAVLFMLYQGGAARALAFSLCRVSMAALLFSGFSGFFFSAAGALLSWGVMAMLQRTQGFSIIGVSLAGGLSHNLGQLIMAAIFTRSPGMIPAYLPVLMIAGAAMGFINGMISSAVMRALKVTSVAGRTIKNGKK